MDHTIHNKEGAAGVEAEQEGRPASGRPMVQARGARAIMQQENKTAVLGKELVAQLEHLRSATREASRIYLSNIESDIVGLIEHVRELNSSKKKDGRRETILRMREALDDLDIKPEKGRRKDLKRIEAVVDTMAKVVSK